ncbi:24613_t:CDS:1, partial [Gigaspora rosea]
NKKVVAMCQIRSEITHLHQMKKINELKKKYTQIQIAAPIILSNNSLDNSYISENENAESDQNMESDEDLVSENDDEEFEQQDISSISSWNEAINQWCSLVNEEKETTNDSSNDELEIASDSSIEELVATSIDDDHPAIAPNAKWKLEILFDKNSLEPPAYIDLLIK